MKLIKWLLHANTFCKVGPLRAGRIIFIIERQATIVRLSLSKPTTQIFFSSLFDMLRVTPRINFFTYLFLARVSLLGASSRSVPERETLLRRKLIIVVSLKILPSRLLNCPNDFIAINRRMNDGNFFIGSF